MRIRDYLKMRDEGDTTTVPELWERMRRKHMQQIPGEDFNPLDMIELPWTPHEEPYWDA